MSTSNYEMQLAIDQESTKNSDYQNYQLQWMIDHNYSLEDLIDNLNEQIDQNPKQYISNNSHVYLHNAFADWEYESGFNQDLYVCEEEFQQTEN